MEILPIYIPIVFAIITLLTIAIFYKASSARKVLFILLFWLIAQMKIAISGFYYHITNVFPPRLILAVFPPLIFILVLFLTRKGRNFIDSLDPKWLTLLHTVRVPVELILLWLSMYKVIPTLMTFEGKNLDIIAGLTAPVIFYFGYIKPRLSRKFLLAWNIVCLGLLFNIIIIAILSAPFPFQQLAFDQPNIAVLYFPFNLLPGLIVPLVLFSHLATIRSLLRKSN